MPFVRTRELVFVITAAVMVLLYVLTAGAAGFPLDDSWIHQVYGRNLAENGEWAFIPGEPSGASTSPLYTVLLAVGYALNVPYFLWTHLLGVVALALSGVFAARMAGKLLPDNAIVSRLAGMAVILTWHLIWAAASGMETIIFAMFTLILTDFVWDDVNRVDELMVQQGVQRGAIFGVLSALAMSTRPEGALLAGICGLFLLLSVQNPLRLRWWVLGSIIGFGMGITPYLLLNLQLNGSIFPATADAKQAQHALLLAIPFTTRFSQMVIPIIAGGQFLLIPGMVYFVGSTLLKVRRKRQLLVYFIPMVWAAALVALYAARLPAAYQHGRYVIPALPGMIVLGVVGTYHLWRLGAGHTLARVLSRTLALASMLVLLYFAVVLGPVVYTQDVSIINEEMVALAHWIDDNLPEDELLAIHDIGAVGYFAPRPILDIAGLVNEEVVPLIGDERALWALIEEQNAQYLMAFPDQLPGRDPTDERLCFHHQSEGRSAIEAGGGKMIIYRLAWDGTCE